jgi:hypothetical protein
LTKYEFLAKLHELLRPKVYLEVGVQTGASLALAAYSELAIGIDPYPLVNATGNQRIYPIKSNDFFNELPGLTDLDFDSTKIDMAYIDGSHLFEDAIWDFAHIEKYCHPGSVVVMDDILPYNEAIANREQPPGDWTGDVWKCTHALIKHRPDLHVYEVDTVSTGTLLVYGFGNGSFFRQEVEHIIEEYLPITGVPAATIERTYAVSTEKAIEDLMEWRATSMQLEDMG